MARYDDINDSMLWVLAIASALLTVTTVLFFQTVFFSWNQSLERSRAAMSPNYVGLQVLADQRARLGSYGWVNKDQKTTMIPIEKAMDLVLKDSAGTAP